MKMRCFRNLLLSIALFVPGVSIAGSHGGDDASPSQTPPHPHHPCQEQIALYQSMIHGSKHQGGIDDGLYNLARAYDQCGMKQASISTLKTLIERNPTPLLKYESCFRVADHLFASQNYASSISFYDCSFDPSKANPFKGIALARKGWALRRMGRAVDAARAFNAALREGESSFKDSQIMESTKDNSFKSILSMVAETCIESNERAAMLLLMTDAEYATSRATELMEATKDSCDSSLTKEQCSCIQASARQYILRLERGSP